MEQLPDEWVERIFERIAAVYGVQKTSSMWTGVDPKQVKRAWGQALGKYPRESLAAAVRAMPDECEPWPPTLPEFVALVKGQIQAPEHMRALPVPPRTQDEIAAGAEQMRRIRAMLGGAIKRVPA
jgi:hypothetical protein